MAWKVVEVAWEDSNAAMGWRPIQEYLEMHRDPLICYTVGYVLEDSKKQMVIVQSSGESDGDAVAATMCIPRSVIRKVTVLRRGKPVS